MKDKKIMIVYRDKNTSDYHFYRWTPEGEQYVCDTKYYLWDRLMRYQREGYEFRFCERQ